MLYKVLVVLVLLGHVNVCMASQTPRWVGAVIHHSATESGDAAAFRRYHIEVKGWDDIGYHFVILRDGTIEPGRPLNKEGAHKRGRNRTHVGICLVGNDTFTKAQLVSLVELLKQLQGEHAIVAIEPHHEDCPGDGIDFENLKSRFGPGKEL